MQLLYVWYSAVGCGVFGCFHNVQSVADFRHNLSLSGFSVKLVRFCLFVCFYLYTNRMCSKQFYWVWGKHKEKKQIPFGHFFFFFWMFLFLELVKTVKVGKQFSISLQNVTVLVFANRCAALVLRKFKRVLTVGTKGSFVCLPIFISTCRKLLVVFLSS